MRALSIAVALALLLGCAPASRSPTLPPPAMDDDPRAAAVVRALEEDLRALALAPPERRRAAQAAFGERLRRDLEACRGTRYENKPLYWLVDWLLAFGDEAATQEALRHLDRLETLPSPAFRNAGRNLRVTALLRLGRAAEAQALAERLDASVPEFGAGARVAFHALAGQPAPPLPGRVLASPPATREAPTLLAFVAALDGDSRLWLDELFAAAPASWQRVIVLVGSDPLSALPAGSAYRAELRWAALAEPELAAWRVPALPASIVLDGERRTVLAVDPPRWRLQQTVRP
ncbi:MAG: hypothetical protein RMM29_07720 [Planctomycetota bacterium]|nr:hypothetical protein [Planctomycetota bacterium]MCX8039649.1 hypothetical protein [Planctomycetota bacterium]MDW8373516.1 hypothetical protein [Planctomycetota bacterium]